jgi:hypothetical protein
MVTPMATMVRAWFRDSPAAALTAARLSLVMSGTAGRQSLIRLLAWLDTALIMEVN